MALGAIPASVIASAAACANSSALVRSCLPNLVTPTPITATRRMRPPQDQEWCGSAGTTHHTARPANGRGKRGRRGTVGRMTVEEALLAAVGLVALVLLFLGLSDVLEGDD